MKGKLATLQKSFWTNIMLYVLYRLSLEDFWNKTKFFKRNYSYPMLIYFSQLNFGFNK